MVSALYHSAPAASSLQQQQQRNVASFRPSSQRGPRSLEVRASAAPTAVGATDRVKIGDSGAAGLANFGWPTEDACAMPCRAVHCHRRPSVYIPALDALPAASCPWQAWRCQQLASAPGLGATVHGEAQQAAVQAAESGMHISHAACLPPLLLPDTNGRHTCLS